MDRLANNMVVCVCGGNLADLRWGEATSHGGAHHLLHFLPMATLRCKGHTHYSGGERPPGHRHGRYASAVVPEGSRREHNWSCGHCALKLPVVGFGP